LGERSLRRKKEFHCEGKREKGGGVVLPAGIATKKKRVPKAERWEIVRDKLSNGEKRL